MPSPAQLPFAEAIKYFGDKIKLPSSGYADIAAEQNALAFVVAGAQNDALITDFYNGIKKAQEQGTGYAAFQAEFDATVARNKWAHTGQPGWRSKVIYDTNMTQSYNAGRWQQQWSNREAMPYLRYRHTSIENPRLEHKAWDGKILPITDSWWNTHYPANGYGCKCRVDALTAGQASKAWAAEGKTGPDAAPPLDWQDVTIGKNGSAPRTVRTPKGVDAGFAGNPGRTYLEPHTVPPLQGYNAVLRQRETAWPTGMDRPPLPKPTRVPASIRLPTDTPPADAVRDFLDVFGATPEQGAVFIDAAETAVVVSKALFISGTDKSTDNYKWLATASKAARLEDINLLAMTLAQPDEIWWFWDEDRLWSKANPDAPKKWILKRRYLRAFEVDGSSEFGLAAFEWGAQGWTGVTSFTATHKTPEARLAYFDKNRVGRNVYKKGTTE